jgi:bacterioferritin
MKGSDKVLNSLNKLLADELTAISEYMVHAEMCSNWGYTKLHSELEKVAMDEMHHAEWLIHRLIFLEGIPVVNKLNPMRIAKSVPEMVTYSMGDELDAIHSYNAAIRVASDLDDQSTVDLLRKILLMEEGHLDWAGQQSDQIEQMGRETYLGNQTKAV